MIQQKREEKKIKFSTHITYTQSENVHLNGFDNSIITSAYQKSKRRKRNKTGKQQTKQNKIS